MKKIITICILIIGIMLLANNNMLQAQNLVPNPSFEVYDTCPNSVGQVSRCVGWFPFANTPDYFNACADSSTLVNVPYTCGGFHYAATGNAMCGMICAYGADVHLFDNYREVIGCKLSIPLQIGTIYYGSFNTSLSLGGYMGNYIASNGLGIKLTTKKYNFPNPIFTNPTLIDNNPVFYSSQIITDTNWIIISGHFIADSAYNYLAIGNFFDAAHTDTLHLGSFIFRSYYFIDNVCLSEQRYCIIDETSENFINSSKPVVFPNPADKQISIRSLTKIISYKIYNLQGELICSSETISRKPGEIININCSGFPEGLYFISILNKNFITVKKVLINH